MIGAQHLKVWGDHYPFTAEGKGYTLDKIRPKRIIVTSNYRISDIYEDPKDHEPIQRRFKEIEHRQPLQQFGDYINRP